MCKIKNCQERKIYAKGYCKFHYYKQYRANLSPEQKQRLHESSLRSYQKNRVKRDINSKKYYQTSHGKTVRARIQRNFRQRIKKEVLIHYSNGKLECANCNFKDMRALCLDHIANDGAKQREKLFGGKRKGSPHGLFRWLKKNNFPPGFQVLCANCNLIKEFERNKSITFL